MFFHAFWVYGACRSLMLVRGSVTSPASPLTKGPQPGWLPSKSSWAITVPPAAFPVALGSGAVVSAIRRTSSRVTAAAPATAPMATVTLPSSGAVKVTEARWA